MALEPKQHDALQQKHKQAMLAAILISFAVIALYFVPYGHYLLYPLMLFYTFVHEMGHGIAAEIVGGDFSHFVMWADGSGTAISMLSANSSRFAIAFVAFAGLIAPALLAAILLALARSQKGARLGLYTLTILCALSVIFYVRNLFGIAFVLAATLLFAALAHFLKNKALHQYSLLFIAITLLTAVFSRGDYLFTDSAQTATGTAPSDVGQIANMLFLPYWFWGALIGLLSIAILILGIRAFFRSPQLKNDETKPQTPKALSAP